MIAFKRLGYLGHLPKIFDEVLLARAVMKEEAELSLAGFLQ